MCYDVIVISIDTKSIIFHTNINEEAEWKSSINHCLMNKHFEGSCELLSLNMILMLTSC